MIFTPNSEKNKRNSKLIQIIKCNKQLNYSNINFTTLGILSPPWIMQTLQWKPSIDFFYFTNTSCILVDNLNISVCLTVCLSLYSMAQSSSLCSIGCLETSVCVCIYICGATLPRLYVIQEKKPKKTT